MLDTTNLFITLAI